MRRQRQNSLCRSDTVLVCNEMACGTPSSGPGLPALAAELRLTTGGCRAAFSRIRMCWSFPVSTPATVPASFLEPMKSNPNVVGQVFLRAKANYLLDRSIADNKIAPAMVVCIDPSTHEVGDIAARSEVGGANAWRGRQRARTSRQRFVSRLHEDRQASGAGSSS